MVFPMEKKRGRYELVSFHAPRNLMFLLDELIEQGYFGNRSEALRIALFKLIYDTMHLLKNSEKMVMGYR